MIVCCNQNGSNGTELSNVNSIQQHSLANREIVEIVEIVDMVKMAKMAKMAEMVMSSNIERTPKFVCMASIQSMK